jgi:hypothetical protein
MVTARDLRDAATGAPDAGEAWVAEIQWHAGRRAGRFRVVARHASGHERVVRESAPVEWPPRETHSVDALADAVTDLEASLVREGWTPLPPGEAWYAKRFTRVSPGIASGATHEREPPWPPGTEALPRCEITWDAGYLASRFEAVALDPSTRRRRSIGTSTPFRLLFMDEPDQFRREFGDEVERLAAALVEAGWEPAGRGAAWYAARFVRPARST